MDKQEIKRIRSMYSRCWPSVIILHNDVQYYCSNWSSIEEVVKKLGLSNVSECKHAKFQLENWRGSHKQLMELLSTCDQAKRDQVIKFGVIGWYVTWSTDGITYNTHT